MLENMPGVEKILIYKGLKKLIEMNTGEGFVNADQGHPAYTMGADGKIDKNQLGDSPDSNALFKILKEISQELKNKYDTSYNWWYDFTTWEKFCKFAVDCYEKNKREIKCEN